MVTAVGLQTLPLVYCAFSTCSPEALKGRKGLSLVSQMSVDPQPHLTRSPGSTCCTLPAPLTSPSLCCPCGDGVGGGLGSRISSGSQATPSSEVKHAGLEGAGEEQGCGRQLEGPAAGRHEGVSVACPRRTCPCQSFRQLAEGSPRQSLCSRCP